MSILDKYIRSNSRFVKLESGDSMICDIREYAETKDMNGNPAIAYKVVLLDDDQVRIFQSASLGLARQIDALPDNGIGHRVKIEKEGAGFQTTYRVTLHEKNVEEMGE